MSGELVLHGYWRSSAAYRVRIALNLKGLAFAQLTHDLRTGAQKAPDYRTVAPHGLVPALTLKESAVEPRTFIQSPAIIEWIEERYPLPPLLPTDIDARAIVRSMAAIIACDIHPLNNLRVLNNLRSGFVSMRTGLLVGWLNGWGQALSRWRFWSSAMAPVIVSAPHRRSPIVT